MADGTVDNLNIQISAEARSAEKSLNSLSSTLLKVNKDLLSSVGSIRKVSKEVGTLKSAIDSLGKVNMNSSGVNKTLNSFKRMFSADMRNFDPTAFQNVLNSLQAFSSIPDVSNNINRFISSISRLANAGDKTGQTANDILSLGEQTKLAAKELKGIGAISNDLNLFVQSVGRLASAGGKTSQTASGLGVLANETVQFFETMKKAPKISENTIRMTQALAQLANAGGKVGTAAGTITNSFNKLSGIGRKTGNVISKAASKIVSSFNAIGNSGGKIKLATSGFSNLFRSLAPILGIYGIFDLGRKAIDLSSDLTEVQNVVRVSFGSMEEYANNFAKTAMEQFGLSELAAKNYAGTMMAILNSSGVERRTAAEMSTTLAGLAGDLASFYNISQDTAWERIMSGMAGEIEPLRRLGINLSIANLQAYALSQGITKSWQAMSQAEQVMLRYNYLMELTTAQQGDFARTSGKLCAA